MSLLWCSYLTNRVSQQKECFQLLITLCECVFIFLYILKKINEINIIHLRLCLRIKLLFEIVCAKHVVLRQLCNTSHLVGYLPIDNQ